MCQTLTTVKLTSQAFQEIPSIGLYCVDFSTKDKEVICIDVYPRRNAVWPGTQDLVTQENLIRYINVDNTVKFRLSSSCMPSHIPPLNKGLPTDVDLDIPWKPKSQGHGTVYLFIHFLS